jgi:UMF1 family MFS transporter
VKRIATSARHIKNFRQLLKFIISYLIYNDGIVVIISFASIYGASRFGMSTKQLITFFIMMQPSSMLGAAIFGYVLDKIGPKRTITISLILWLGVLAGAFFCATVSQFYMVGIVAGLAIGSSQSSSRTMLALLTPSDKMGEFFGFYAFTGKMSAIIGPLVYGEIARITGEQRWAILSVSLFFIIGLIILQTVNEAQGKAVAIQWQEEN